MINIPVRRLRPNRAALGALLGLVWLVSVGPIRDFVWADLREGMVRLNGISRGTRALIIVGFGLLVLGAGLIVFDDALRALFELIPMSSGAAAGLAGRGAAFPTALIPITLFLLVLGWSYLMAGAMHSHPLVRLVALIVYAGHFIPWLGRGLSVLDTSPLALVVVALALLGVPVLYVVRWRRAARPVLEFFLCLGFLGIILLVAQAQGVALWRAGGQPVLLSNIEAAVFSLEALVLPMLFLIGVDIANFTKHAAGWIVALAVARFPRWLVGLLLAIALMDRLYAVAVELMERLEASNVPAQATEYAGALGEIACVAAVWWLVSYVASRKNNTEIIERSPDRVLEAADTYAFKIILGFTAAALATVVIAGIALALHGISGILLEGTAQQTGISLANRLLLFLQTINGSTARLIWRYGLAAVALGAGIWFAMKGRSGVAMYLGLFGALQVWWEITQPEALLGWFAWRGDEPVDFWWVVVLNGFALYWLVRRELTAARAARLLFLVLITWLLRQTDFIENPFDPVAGLAGFTGAGFIAFGLLWDALTAGSWANVETPGLPRVSRIFLYLGYVLLTVTLVNWAVTTHNLGEVERFTGEGALVGLARFGRPLLYGVFALTLALPARHEGIEEPYVTPAGDEER